jgi:hypothetical protein
MRRPWFAAPAVGFLLLTGAVGLVWWLCAGCL